jgi:hypothetical protein
MNANARDFLTRCFAPGETIALLLRREGTAQTQQRFITLEQALAPRYLAWLAYKNHHAANIYLSANPLRFGSRRRTKESVASVRHLYLDIDTDGEARLAALLASDSVPTPNAILSTSPGRYQVIWRVEGFGFELQESTLKLLALAFGGDPACTDRNRMLRLPGFFNLKYSPAHLVTAQYPADSIHGTADFRLSDVVATSLLRMHRDPRRLPASKRSRSEEDWAWVLNELKGGREATELTRELADRRSDKANPLYYAQRTVDVASARLWLVDGTSIDDVIAKIEARRRLELPRPLSWARAREIATTAQSMIVRQKVP